MHEGFPYWRLSGFYLCYFAALGALLPYLPLFLHERGLTVLQIGLLASILTGMKIIAPNCWGWLADHYLNRTLLVRLVSVACVLSFCAMLYAGGFTGYALALLLFGVFWHAPIPQVEAVTLRLLGGSEHAYARVRLWGSAGFLLSVTGMGYWFATHGLHQLLPAVIGLLVLMALSSFLLPLSAGASAAGSPRGFSRTLREPAVLALMAAAFLMQFSHAPYYAYYSVYLEHHGYTRPLIGKLWAVGVLSEIAIYVVLHRCIAYAGLRRIFIASMLLAALRWQLIAWCATSLPLLFLAQLLHAATFGTFHACAVLLVHHYFPPAQHGRGQALYSSASFGAGLALGSPTAGWLWEVLGPRSMYHAGSLVALLGGVLAWQWLREPAVRR